MHATFFAPLLFVFGAMFFSYAIVDLNQVSQGQRLHFNRTDVLWMLAVMLSVGCPIWMIYLLPYWQTSMAVTTVAILLAFEFTFPSQEMAHWRLFDLVPKTAFWLLAAFAIASAWLVFLYFWIERALGSTYKGILNLSL